MPPPRPGCQDLPPQRRPQSRRPQHSSRGWSAGSGGPVWSAWLGWLSGCRVPEGSCRMQGCPAGKRSLGPSLAPAAGAACASRPAQMSGRLMRAVGRGTWPLLHAMQRRAVQSKWLHQLSSRASTYAPNGAPVTAHLQVIVVVAAGGCDHATQVAPVDALVACSDVLRGHAR